VLQQFADRPSEWRYGYELSRATALKSGTLYPILMRLAKHSLLETKWVVTEDGVPPRHIYRLTPRGVGVTRASSKKLRSGLKARRPVMVGDGA